MDKQSKREANKILMSLCFRIEKMCRYSPLDNQEVNDQSMKDRNIVEGFYCFFKSKGDNQEVAARKARANAIRIIFTENP